ncbi:unnamed protein product [Diabrotica balteata]|uniref:Chibby n=1 Tax=Diabrotica balteata TaxID=107213 RepID=A0A9N9XHL5_DIABA|nr:unnamed protein product [Diabrotica balteata]
MPIFGSKFSPKKIPTRKANAENVPINLTETRVHLDLGDQKFAFERGNWVPEDQQPQQGMTYRNRQRLKKKIQELEEENNMLRLKYEMMLNMLTQAAAEGQIVYPDLEKFRKKKK